VHALGPEAIVALQILDAIKPRFSVWGRDRGTKNYEVPVEQPAAIAETDLLIGDLSDATLDTCRRCHCDAVLVLCPEKVRGDYAERIREITDAKIEVRMVETWDTDDFDIIKLLFKKIFVAWVGDLLHRRQKLLVVSWAGTNRSAAIVAGIMVFNYDRPLIEAVRSLTHHRGVVLTNRKFRFLLVKACVAHNKRLGAITCGWGLHGRRAQSP
jgi:hypothetical protein